MAPPRRQTCTVSEAPGRGRGTGTGTGLRHRRRGARERLRQRATARCPVAESLKHFEHRGGRTAWARVRDRLAALSIEINTRVVRVTSPAARDRASTEDTGQHAAHRTHCWPGHDREACCGHAASAWCTAPQVVIASAGSARLVDAKDNQHVSQRRQHPAKPHVHHRDRFRTVHLYDHEARSWVGSGPVIEGVNPR